LIFVVFNTLFNPARPRRPGALCARMSLLISTFDGSFVLEAFVPTYLTRLHNDQYVDSEAIAVNEVWLDVGRHDPVTQRLEESHVVLSREGVRVYPIVTRYAWPSELDLMARIAGLRLKDRWADWNREPFTSSSSTHVSVYVR
jgi:hypothetical protein